MKKEDIKRERGKEKGYKDKEEKMKIQKTEKVDKDGEDDEDKRKAEIYKNKS